jgi:biotin-(acetyl-CoA carboxylase) ligase
MRDPLPTFPPLLTGHKLAIGKMPANWAQSRVADGRLGAGDLVWSEDADDLRAALVLEPDVVRARCPEIIFTAMVAIGDAVGALSAPEVSVTYRWPSVILVNEAKAGFVDLVISETDKDDVPDWMVLSLHMRLRPKRSAPEPGRVIDTTTLWDEGCGELSRTALLESVSRHLVNLIHIWSEDGFKPIHSQWWGRLSEKAKFADGALAGDDGAALLGLDESGNALIKTSAGTHAVPTMEALARLRTRRGDGV